MSAAVSEPTSQPSRPQAPNRSGRTKNPRWIASLVRSLPIVPTLLLLAVFFVGPMLWALYGSFTNMALTGPQALHPSFIGTQNYQRLFSDPAFPRALWLTVVFVVASAIIGQNVLGMALALLMQRASRPLGAIVRAIVVFTWVLPELVAAFVLYAFFNNSGTLNQILAGLGIHGLDWLYATPMLAIILGNTWRGTAFSMMVYQAALGGVPGDLTEAAMIDGANGRQRFFQVTLPVIRGSVTTNLMLITLQTLAVFTLIWVMTAGGPVGASATLPVLAYQAAFQIGDIGYGTAIAAIMLLVGVAFAGVYARLLHPRGGDR